MKPIRRESVVDQVTRSLIDELSNGTWTTGEKLPTEKELGQRLGASRNAVREAIKQLEFMGAITVRQGDGIFVQHFDQSAYFKNLSTILRLENTGIHELVEARRSVEGTTSRLAAERADATDFDELEAVLVAGEAVYGDPEKFAAHDADFHLKVARASHNQVLVRIVESLRGALLKQQSRIAAIPGTPEASMRYHRDIYEAIRARDGAKAASLMDAHILNVLSRIER